MRYHFVGICGIGMSALASIALHRGHVVSGSDSGSSEYVPSGALFYDMHSAANITDDIDFVVRTTNVLDDNPEIVHARLLGIRIMHRAECLSHMIGDGRIIGIMGSHGKTTTTSLLGYALDMAGANPSIVSGGIMENYGTNIKFGSNDLWIVEIDESDGSFDYFNLDICVVLNMDFDHVEYYGTQSIMQERIKRFLSDKVRYCIVNDGPLTEPTYEKQMVAIEAPRKTEVMSMMCNNDYTLQSWDIAGAHRYNISCDHIEEIYDDCMMCGTRFIYKGTSYTLPLAGHHNIKNAIACIETAGALGYKLNFAGFKGTQRRLSILGYTTDGVRVIDDYAHHPAEINAVLDCFNQEINIVFEPHRPTRLIREWDKFVQAFSRPIVAQLFIMPIFFSIDSPDETDPDLLAKFASATNGRMVYDYCDINNLTRHIHNDPIIATEALSEIELCNKATKQTHTLLFLGAGHSSCWAKQLVK